MGKLTMNKKKLAIATLVTGLVFSLGVYSINSSQVATSKPKTEKSNSIQILEIPASHATFNSVEALENYADLIIVGRTTKALEEGQPIIRRDSAGYIKDFYTVTPFEIKKVLKGPKKSNTEIPVIQPAVTIAQPGQQNMTVMITEGFSLLKKNSSYLLYLKQVDEVAQEMYSVVAVNQGKFNLDKTDREEEAIAQEEQQYSSLKAKVLEKHKDLVVGNQ